MCQDIRNPPTNCCFVVLKVASCWSADLGERFNEDASSCCFWTASSQQKGRISPCPHEKPVKALARLPLSSFPLALPCLPVPPTSAELCWLIAAAELEVRIRALWSLIPRGSERWRLGVPELLLGWKATRVLAEMFIKTLVKALGSWSRHWESRSVGLTALRDVPHVVPVFSGSSNSYLCQMN